MLLVTRIGIFYGQQSLKRKPPVESIWPPSIDPVFRLSSIEGENIHVAKFAFTLVETTDKRKFCDINDKLL